MREATAATAQVESTRRLMAEDESELAILGRRLNEMNAAVAASKQALAAYLRVLFASNEFFFVD